MVLPAHLANLHRDQIRIQNEVLKLQASELTRLGSEKPEPGDPNGAPARQQIQQLEDQLRKLELQIFGLANQLQQVPPGAIPPEVMQNLVNLKNQATENAGTIRANFVEIRNKVDGGVKGEIPDGGEPDKASNGEPPPLGPAYTAGEAGDIILAGQVRNPRHLVELFEQIAQQNTPKGNLTYYRQRGR